MCLDLFPVKAYKKQCDKAVKEGKGRKEEKGKRKKGGKKKREGAFFSFEAFKSFPDRSSVLANSGL